MSPVTKEFSKQLFEGKIVYGGNPVLRWMSGNVVVETHAVENINVTKVKSPEKMMVLLQQLWLWIELLEIRATKEAFMINVE